MYLLPAIDILGGQAVRLAKGDYAQVTVYNEDPLAQACEFEAAGAQWLHVVDLDGARTGEPENIAHIEAIAKNTQLKLEVGGGIRSISAIERLLDADVARVVLGTSLVAQPEFAQEAITRFGDALAAGVDARKGQVAVAGWEQEAGCSAEDLVAQVAQMGFRHLVFTDIARDGMQTGIDPEAYVRIAELFGHPVIASGGVASLADIKALAGVAASIEGVIAGRAIYEGNLTVRSGVAACAAAVD